MRPPVSPVFADDVPYVVMLVTLAEGPTMMTSIVGCAPEKVPIGMPVEVTSADWTEEISLPKFKPARTAMFLPLLQIGLLLSFPRV